MKFRILLMTILASFAASAFAEKPEWAGKGKPTDEQKAAHKEAMTSKSDDKTKKEMKGMDGETSDEMHEEMSEDMNESMEEEMNDEMMDGEEAAEGDDGMMEKKGPGPQKGPRGAEQTDGETTEKAPAPKKEKEWYNFWD